MDITNSEVALEGFHLLTDEGRLQHGNGSLLEGGIGSTVKVRAARADA